MEIKLAQGEVFDIQGGDGLRVNGEEVGGNALNLKPDRTEIPMVGNSPVGKNVYEGEIFVKVENGGFYNIWGACNLMLPCVTRKPDNYESLDNPENGNKFGIPIKFVVRIASDNVSLSDVTLVEDTGRLIVTNTSEYSYSPAVTAKVLGLNKLWKSVTVSAIPTDKGTEIIYLEVV